MKTALFTKTRYRYLFLLNADEREKSWEKIVNFFFITWKTANASATAII